MIDPDNKEICSALRRMGIRRRPPLSFLRRQSFLNRWIGRLLGRPISAPQPELTLFVI
jgi:hypothetical protein